MKTIKIFGFPSHQQKERTSGVDFCRVIQPMRHLNGWTNGEVKFEVKIFDPVADDGLDWLKVASDFDIIFFNYTANPWAFAAMGAMARKANRTLIMDMDDSLWNILEDNPAFGVYKKGSDGIKNFTAIVNEVDVVTCTNRYLKNVITKNSRKVHDLIKVFDNYIDLEKYNHSFTFKDTHEINLLHFGSTTHFLDLQNKGFVEGVDRIMKDYPNVNFITVGAFVPMFRNMWGRRYINDFGHQDIYKWIGDRFPHFMDMADICLVPLEDSVYTRCKSAIKYLEMSSAKKPGVWQDIRQYQEVIDGTNGLLAKNGNEWYEAIKKLIDDKELRKQMGENAYKDVVGNHQIKDNIDQYAKLFIDVAEKKQ